MRVLHRRIDLLNVADQLDALPMHYGVPKLTACSAPRQLGVAVRIQAPIRDSRSPVFHQNMKKQRTPPRGVGRTFMF